jgi:formiminoglutamate deiminase
MAGLAEAHGPNDDNFWTWREWMYKFLDRLTPEDVEAIAAQAFMEMLETGFTRAAEFHYLHHDPAGSPYANLAETGERICAAANETGIGLTLLPVFYAQGGFDRAPPAPGQRRFLNGLDQFERLLRRSGDALSRLPDGRLGVAPHSLRAVSVEDLIPLVEMGIGGPLHIHVSEQEREVVDCLAWCGLRPVEKLMELVDVDPRWCLIHATHLSAREVALVAKSGAVVGLCPITEANLGDGVFPASAYLKAGGQIAIGTDSNVEISAPGELRMMEYAQRLNSRGRNVLSDPRCPSTGRHLFSKAVIGGGLATGGEPGLWVGGVADIVGVDADTLALPGLRGDSLIDSVVFAPARRPFASVWRRGVEVVKDGEHIRRSEISRRFRQVVRRIVAD